MKNFAKIVSVMCALVIVFLMLPIIPMVSVVTPVSAEDEPLKAGDIVRRTVEWNGQQWELDSIVDSNGVPIEASYINENNHLTLESSVVRLSGYRHAAYPPKDADGRQLDENNILAMLDGDDTNRNNDAFDVNWRMKIQNYTEFNVNWYQGNVELHFMEDGTSLVYRTSPNSATMSRVYVDFGGEWHDWSLRVRGLHATVLMDGRELFNYYIFRQPAAWRYISFRQAYEYDFDSKVEVEYLEVVDRRNPNVKMVAPAIWDGSKSVINKYAPNTPITLEADAGAADGEKKTIDFYVNDVKVGSGIDQGKITTTTSGGSSSGGCEGSGGGGTTTTEEAHNASFTLESGLPAGRYNLTAVCNGEKSFETVLIIENNVKANVVCAESVNYGESVNVGINCTEGSYSTAEILLDGEFVGTVANGQSINVADFSVGTHVIGAKLYQADGTQFIAESAKINVNASGEAVKTAEINREYQLDYVVSGGGTVNINDGYFTLNLNHSGDTLTYSSDKGVETYKNLGDGKYRVVTTGGYGELYYNGQLAFSFRMPFTGKAATSVNYSGGVSDVKLGGTRVKATRLHKDIEGEAMVELYDVDMQNHYSVEFDKTDTSAQDIMVYDGEYEAIVQINSSGITVNSQDVTAAPTTKVKLTDEVQTGYYRLTVTAGLAQLFVDNKCVGSFRCPVNVHRNAIMMRNSNPNATTFVAVKDTDDLYYYSEDFEGNNEKGFSEADYWYNEEEYFVLAEGQEYKLKHEVKGEDDKYLELSGEGYYALNVNADEPVLRWKASYEGNGTFEAIARNYRNFGHIGAKYYAESGTWSLFVAKPFTITHTDENGTSTQTTERRMYEIVSGVSYPLGSTEHDFEMVVGYDSLTLNIDGNLVATTDRLAETHKLVEVVGETEKTYEISNNGSHGRVGFAVYGGALKVDDFYYEGDGGAAPGVTYSRLKVNFDVYRNHKGQVVGAANDYASPILISDDNGLTWTVTNASKTRKGKLSSNNVNLSSGKFLRVQYASKNDDSSQSAYSYALLYNVGTDTEATRTMSGKMVEYSDNRVMIEPDGSMDGVPYSGMGTRLIQLKSGPYAGRVLYTRGGSGERRGTGLLYYSDDYKDPNFEGDPVWHEPNIQLSFASTGGIVLETQCVEMPDGTVRCYVRSDKGFLTYFESFDGGATWDPTGRKVEDLFSTSCCFSIMRVGDTETYCAFWSNDNLTSNIRYYNRPRQRSSFAISYDGMKTWEFVADMEEDDRGNGGQACNHSMRTLDGAAYMGYYDQSGMPDMSRNFRQDLSKVKPLKRFTECHTKTSSSSVGTVSDFAYDYSVVPKATGDAFVNGNYIYTNVNANEYADAEVIAKIVGASADATENGVRMTMGEAVFEFTNGSSDYTLNGEKVEAGFAYCEDGKLHPLVSEIFGRIVSEGEGEYLVLNGYMSDDNLNAIVQKGASVRIEASRESNLLADINSASGRGDGKGIESVLADYADVLDFDADVSGVADVDAMYMSMTGITYKTLSDIKAVFNAVKANRIKAESTESAVALSTVSGGFDNWCKLGRNSGSVSISDGVATLDVKKEINKNFAYGITGVEIPEDEYNFTFGYKYNYGKTNVKIGNGKDILDVNVDSDEITIYTGIRTFKAAVNLEAEKWYTFCGTLKVNESGKVLSLCIRDDEGNEITVCEAEPITKEGILSGFWIEYSGDDAANVQIKDVKVYKGKAIDVIEYTAENGKASATIDFLNDGEMINGIWVDEDFSSEDVSFTDRNPFYQTTKLEAEHFSVNVHDGYMDYAKYISGTDPFEQDILLPTLKADAKAEDIIFEYDLMMPDVDMWQTGVQQFMYFDVYMNHPAKAFRQTMYLLKDRIQVGYSSYMYKDIWADENGEYEGKWMSFKHRYYFDGTDWKCDFYYKKQNDTEWKMVKDTTMNPSTSKSNYIRFYSYGDTQTRICLDNIKVYCPEQPLSNGQLLMGVYNNDRQAGVGYADAKAAQLGAYESKRYTVEEFEYVQGESTPEVSFFVWNGADEWVPIVEKFAKNASVR